MFKTTIVIEPCLDISPATSLYMYFTSMTPGLLQGFMEKTVVFYGHYSATDLDGAISNYDLKLAYLLCVVAYFVISLLFMVHK